LQFNSLAKSTEKYTFNRVLKKFFPGWQCYSCGSGNPVFQSLLDSRLRGSDGLLEFFRILKKRKPDTRQAIYSKVKVQPGIQHAGPKEQPSLGTAFLPLGLKELVFCLRVY
jgi:hypothetical protein